MKRSQTQLDLERMQVARARHLCRTIGPLFPWIEIMLTLYGYLQTSCSLLSGCSLSEALLPIHRVLWYMWSASSLHATQQYSAWARNDACHEKTGHKVFVVVIPKERLHGLAPRQSFFGYDNDKDLKRSVFSWCVSNGKLLCRTSHVAVTITVPTALPFRLAMVALHTECYLKFPNF